MAFAINFAIYDGSFFAEKGNNEGQAVEDGQSEPKRDVSIHSAACTEECVRFTAAGRFWFGEIG